MTRIVEARNLSKIFPLESGHAATVFRSRRARRDLHAVDQVSFSVERGQAVGLVGESGCGKSTLAQLLARLHEPTSGQLLFDGRDLSGVPVRTFANDRDRRRIQMVFQDATDSLNPRDTVFEAIANPVRRLIPNVTRSDVQDIVRQTAERVNIPLELFSRFPHQLSGGQRARVGIARAISVSPDLLVLDEPTSALDASIQSVILKLLARLRDDLQMTYVFVSHDLNVVRMLCDRVMVMYLGKLVEEGPAAEIFRHPRHPYTAALIDAIPQIGGKSSRKERLPGEPQSPVNPDPNVCRFAGRCRYEQPLCRQDLPELLPANAPHRQACHFPLNQGEQTHAPRIGARQHS
ncbi:MAG: oligopeptide/dipeptide ABC transporter ATP-binding protein [Hyphomicrobiales bacterium]